MQGMWGCLERRTLLWERMSLLHLEQPQSVLLQSQRPLQVSRHIDQVVTESAIYFLDHLPYSYSRILADVCSRNVHAVLTPNNNNRSVKDDQPGGEEYDVSQWKCSHLPEVVGRSAKQLQNKMPHSVRPRSAMIQQDASEPSESNENSNAVTDEMSQSVGRCEVIGNNLPTGSTVRKRLDTAAPREMTKIQWTTSQNPNGVITDQLWSTITAIFPY